MKILSYLNVSNGSNLEADSGFVFQKILLQKLAEFGHKVILIGPPDMPSISSEIQLIEIDIPESKFGVRYGFPWVDLQNKLKKSIEGTDILLVNQSELSIALSTLVFEITQTIIPCITYHHYLAVSDFDNQQVVYDPSQDWNGLGKHTWLRQVDSARFSTMNIIGSRYGKDLFIRCSGDLSLTDKFEIIPPPTPYSAFSKAVSNTVPIILYNHRLYDHYGGTVIFQILEKISQRYQFKVIVTDPTSKRSLVRESLDQSVSNIKAYLRTLSFVEIVHFETQNQYQAALNHIDIGIAPLRTGALWSMSIADMMSKKIPVVAFNKGAYAEEISDEDLLFNNEAEFENIFVELITDTNFRLGKGEKAYRRSQEFATENIALKFERVFEGVLKKDENYEDAS